MPSIRSSLFVAMLVVLGFAGVPAHAWEFRVNNKTMRQDYRAKRETNLAAGKRLPRLRAGLVTGARFGTGAAVASILVPLAVLAGGAAVVVHGPTLWRNRHDIADTFKEARKAGQLGELSLDLKSGLVDFPKK